MWPEIQRKCTNESIGDFFFFLIRKNAALVKKGLAIFLGYTSNGRHLMGEILRMENVDTDFHTNTHSHTHLQYVPRPPPTLLLPPSQHNSYLCLKVF